MGRNLDLSILPVPGKKNHGPAVVRSKESPKGLGSEHGSAAGGSRGSGPTDPCSNSTVWCGTLRLERFHPG